MANFAKEQLMKYGWTEGQGLGKNGNGIKEPIKLTSNQNKTGIGYDEDEPWWEKLFDNTTKNVKVECKLHEDDGVNLVESALSKNKLEDKAVVWKLYEWQNFVPQSITAKVYPPLHHQKVSEIRYTAKTIYKPSEHNFIHGKLKRIEEQNNLILRKPVLSANITEKNDMAYRKVSKELDVEENEHEADCIIENASPAEEKECFDVGYKLSKKQRKRVNKLVTQLSTCNLEGNQEKHNFFNNRKLYKRMKKGKGKRLEPSILRHYLKGNKTDLRPFVSSLDDIPDRLENDKKEVQIYFKTTSRNFMSNVDQCDVNVLQLQRTSESNEDGIERKLILCPELKSHIQKSKLADRSKDLVIIDIESEEQKVDADYNFKVPICTSKQFTSKLKNNEKFWQQDTALLVVKNNDREVDLKEEFRACRLNYTIEKKKAKRYRSKCLKKITENLRNKHLTLDLNSVIKNLSAFGLTEEVNAKAIKNKPTQTHLTPV
ncbi:hypothetical protein PUN28_015211 [Cardiocondyla obscurior]|uniref:PinX1-related protein 1 n=1 Tax=Cardiocondyla obscurior TaxID=286306 RepID=A0AAW2F115_9HYME